MAAPEADEDTNSSCSSSSSSSRNQQDAKTCSAHKEEEEEETSSSSSSLVVLSFESLEDVQTRLVLLPRIEEEGVGAVVEQYEEKAQKITSDDDKKNENHYENDVSMTLLRGCILNGICSEKKEQDEDKFVLQDDLKDQDFASILAAIRSAPTPILLQFIKPPTSTREANSTVLQATPATVDPTIVETGSVNTSFYQKDKKTDPSDHTDTTTTALEEEETSSSSSSDTHEEHHDCTATAAAAALTTTTPLPSQSQQQPQSVQKFMSWASSRISATSVAQLAAETSSSLQSAVVEAAAIASRSKTKMATTSPCGTAPTSPPPPSSSLASSSAVSAAAATADHNDTSATLTAAMPTVELGLYLQAASGDFILVDSSSASSSSQRSLNSTSNNNSAKDSRITNSSLLLIRKSPSAEPCPLSCGYSYQWYRSSGDCNHLSKQPQQHSSANKTWSIATTSTAASTFSSSLPSFASSMGQHYSGNTTNGHSNNSMQQQQQRPGQTWTLLPGATRAAFQPTATEVGHWLRCVVRIRKPENDQHDDNGEDEKQVNQDDCCCSSSSSRGSSVDEEDNRDENDEVIILETRERVSAALALFNGSRQALVRGAQFGGIVGRGNAEGRQFRIKVGMTFTTMHDPMTRTKRVESAVTIYQVSGSTAEPMHPENEPIVCVSAVADHEEPKALELTFPKGLPESAGMVEALTTNGRFQIATANRLGRESLLLSIGIANFDGKPVDLDANMVLFDDDDDVDVHQLLIASSSSSTGGVSSTALSCGESTSSESLDRFHGIHSLSPANSAPATPCRRGGDGLSILQLEQRCHSFDNPSEVIVDFVSPVAATMQAGRISDLEKELEFLRGKLTRKDKAFSELQRHVAQSESSRGQLEQQLSSSQEEVSMAKSKLCAAEQRVESLNDELLGIRDEHASQVASLESKVVSQSDRIFELEKSVRALQNEKALLSASVEARESKLSKMAGLQISFDQLSEKVSESDALRAELEEANKRHKENTSRLQQLSLSEQDRRSELEKVKQEIVALATRLEDEQARTASCRSELEAQQMKIQKLKAERNSYKQKGDSLAKEIAKVCRNGRTIKDVEKIILDDASRKQEVTLLREQKRKALDEIQQYRTVLEQCRTAQKLAGLDHDSTRVLERNAELERLLSELTEYIAAKEQQLGTLKLVNDELQSEIRTLTKAHRSKNLGKNDV